MVQVFISKKEEKALGIQEKETVSWRRQYNIPDSDGFEEMLQEIQKRGRSDTMSTTQSDSHDPKRPRLGGISE